MSKLVKFLRILIERAYWPALIRGIAPTIEHAPALSHLDFKTVIDVGANKGQFAYFASCQWPSADLYCFEPLPGPRRKLEHLLGGKAEVYCCALGVTEGSAQIHVASREDSSSLLPLGERQKALFGMEEVSELTVPVRRLDTCFGADLPRDALLKIDVQGFELEVLMGASELLTVIDAVYVEVSYAELYDGQALFDEVNALLVAKGFEPIGRHNEQFHDRELVQADILYWKRATVTSG